MPNIDFRVFVVDYNSTNSDLEKIKSKLDKSSIKNKILNINVKNYEHNIANLNEFSKLKLSKVRAAVKMKTAIMNEIKIKKEIFESSSVIFIPVFTKISFFEKFDEDMISHIDIICGGKNVGDPSKFLPIDSF